MKHQIKRIVSAFMSAVLLVPMGMFTMQGTAAPASELTVSDLKVCSLEEPLGIDRSPTFSWTITGTGKGEKQTAYQITLSSSSDLAEAGKGDVWDSGKVPSEETVDLAYTGDPLASRATYYWQVQIWDDAGGTARGPVGRFSTGVLEESEWEGDWIGFRKHDIELDLTGTKWIWKSGSSAVVGVPAGQQYFRRTFSLRQDKTLESVYIGYTADDKATLYFNGKEIGTTSTWSTGGLYDATAAAQDENTVAILGDNTTDGYAGMAAKIQITYTDGTVDTIVSDGDWKVSDTAAAGWYEPGFDDAGWGGPDQQAAFGESPWGSGVSLETADSRAAVLLRKEFAVKDNVKEAFAYICGLGFFELSFNGKTPDDSLLNPYTTQYDETVLYRTFDVTELLQEGENAVGVELGNSYYNEIGGVWNWPAAAWRDNPKLLFRLEIRYADGSTDCILSDTSWKMTQDGPITANSMYYGDVYDARKELPGWNTVGFDDSAWQQAQTVAEPIGELAAQMKAPVKRVASFAPESIVKLGEGSYRIQSPEMCSGWIKLMGINQQAGDKITITYGQKLNEDGSVKLYGGGDGEIGNWWPHAYLQQDIYTSAGRADESYEPKFSYKGFEYIQVDGYDGELTADDVVIYRVSNDVETVSTFESSSELFNRLHKMMVTAMADNFQGEHCDPMLEKMGWTGDANVSLDSLMYNFDMSATLPGFIEVMEDGFEHYGTVPVAVPTADWWIDNTPVWNTLFVYGVQRLNNFFGMGSYVEEQYDVMREYALKDIEEIEANGWVWQDGQLADWVAPVGGSDPNAQYNENVSEGSGIAATAYVYGMLAAMCDFAEQVGRGRDVQEYEEAMEQIYEAFNEKFYNAEEQIYETTTWTQIGSRTRYRQTSNLVPLAFGLVPEEYVQGVVDNLVADIVEKDYHLDTGCVGTELILPVLCDYGHSDVAYRIATQDTYPSWGFWVENDAKGTWEMWESTTRSLDHYFLGTYDEWFFSHLAGLTDIQGGYKSFTVYPHLIGDLEYVHATQQTVRGEAGSDWERLENGKARLTVTVPFGSTAKVVLPTADADSVTLDGEALSAALPGVEKIGEEDGRVTVTIGSGTYEFLTGADLTEVYTLSLQTAIEEAEAYGAGVLPLLDSALAEAKKVLADENATQSQINAARDALVRALDLLEGSETRKALRLQVAESKNLYKAGYYQQEAWLSYRSALTAAEQIAADLMADDARLQAAGEALTAAEAALEAAAYENLAAGKTVTASSSLEDSYWGWGIANATDGNRKNMGESDVDYIGYSSKDTPDVDHVEWIYVDLGEEKAVNSAVFYPASNLTGGAWLGYGFPVDFAIQVSSDGQSWTDVYTAEDYPLPVYGALDFSFDQVEARYVRLYASSLRTKGSENNAYRLQLSEFEVYNLPDKTEDTGLLYLGVEGGSLDPAYHIDTDSYTLTANAYATAVALTPVTADGSPVEIDGQSVASGAASAAIQVPEEGRTLTVTAGGKTYTLRLVRGEPTAEDGKKALEIVLGEAVNAKLSEEYANADQSARDAFDMVYLQAGQVFADGAATQTEITAAWTELMDAIHALSMQAGDKQALNEAIEKAEDVDLDGYEDEGKDAFLAALEEARRVRDDGDALQSEIDEAVQALEEAYDALQPIQIIPGDLDGNGTVDIQDVMAACRVLARQNGGTYPTAEEIAQGDLTGDGYIRIDDIMAICRLLAGQNR